MDILYVSVRPNVIHKPQEDVLFFLGMTFNIIFVSRTVNTRKAKASPLICLAPWIPWIGRSTCFHRRLDILTNTCQFFDQRRSKAQQKTDMLLLQSHQSSKKPSTFNPGVVEHFGLLKREALPSSQ